MRYLISLFAAFMLMASPAMAKKPSKKAAAANFEAIEIGKQLYLHDQAAWHGTDALAEKVDLAAQAELRGYVVDPLDNGNLGLVFFAEDEGGHYEFARYEIAGSKVVDGGMREKDNRIALSPLLERMVAARTATIEAFRKREWGFCTKSSANFIGLPPDKDGVIKTYLLTSTTEANTYPFGGHFRFNIDDAGTVVSSRKFTNSCLNMGGKNKEGLVPVALGISHILDDHPTEIHYFQSYYMPMELRVIMQSGVWKIDQGKFEGFDTLPDK